MDAGGGLDSDHEVNELYVGNNAKVSSQLRQIEVIYQNFDVCSIFWYRIYSTDKEASFCAGALASILPKLF